MSRISGHTIAKKHVEDLQSHPLRINFYVDGYGSKKASEVLYDIGDKRLEQHLRQQSLSEKDARSRYDHYYAPPSAAVFAEILSYCLALIEIGVISTIESRCAAAGEPMFPNALLVNQSNPLEVTIGDAAGNILEVFYPLTEEEFAAGRYLDVTCEGVIYSTKKINREKEMAILKRDLQQYGKKDPSLERWIRKNLTSLPEGVFHYRNQDGTIGTPINFEFSEVFFDEVADRIGYYSRLGESKVHWRKGLSDFGEKGVDCDLIMQVIDDLHSDNADAFVFLTNDMDFFPLLERVRSEGKHVFLCGLEGKVSQKLIKSVGRSSFFNLLDEAVLANLPNVFMALRKPESRNISLQLAWLAMRQRQGGAA